MGEIPETPTSPSPTKFGGLGALDSYRYQPFADKSLISGVAGSGGKGAFPAGGAQGVNAVPSDIGSGAYASPPDYYLTQGKKQFKNQLLDMAIKTAGGGEWRNYDMSPQTTVGEEQPSWKKGLSTTDLYDPIMKQEMLRRQQEQVMRYNLGRGV
jgi:hypothetical protein